MFDGLLGRGFAPKGKTLIKLIKNRIDVLRRKKTATIKFLKKDLADLVINGHDVNAYTRAGGLLDELRYLWNLDFVEQTCDFVYKQLSSLQKFEECPEECREAVSSLMFAASGFSELPELRELRQMFHEKYADSLGLFVNQELVENMSSKPFSMEKKVKLLEDVALEFSIRWDSKDFEKRIVRQNSTSVKDPKTTYYKYKPVDRNMALPKREESEGFQTGLSLNRKKVEASERRDLLFEPDKERPDNVSRTSRSKSKDNKAERNEFHLQLKQVPARERRQPIFNEGDTIVMKVKHENLSKGSGHGAGVVDAHKKTEVIGQDRKEFYLQSKKEPSRERHQPIFNEGDTIVMKVKRENHVLGNGHQNGVVDAHKKTEVNASEKLEHSSSKRADKLVIGFKQESFLKGFNHEKNEEHAHQRVEDSTSKPPKPSSKSKRSESIDTGLKDRNGWESRENAILVGKSTDRDPSGVNVKGGEHEYDNANPARKLEEIETERMKSPFYKSLPPPYVKSSSKSRNEKAEASENTQAGCDKNAYGVVKGSQGDDHQVNDIDNTSQKGRTSRRKHIVQSVGDDHTRRRSRKNSRKGLQVLVDEDEDEDEENEEKLMDKLLMHYSKKPSNYEKKEVQESKSRRTKGESDIVIIHKPVRSRSLPPEQWAEPSEPTKTFARATSFQPERSSETKHVHPKLPNYDDLAARFADLKGRLDV